jgi:OOP family OmpA-OmpF porin
MKIFELSIIMVALLVCSLSAYSQITDPKQTVANDATGRANSNVSGSIDNGLSKTEGAIKGLFKKKKKAPAADPSQATNSSNAQVATAAPSIKVYNNYDFVPGDKIIFEDNFAEDQVGEFPAHWDLKQGQAVLNEVAGRKALLLTDGNYCHVLPLIKSPSYLSNNFTIEYDQYGNDAYAVQVFFYAKPDYFGDDNIHIKVEPGYCSYGIGGSNGLSADLPADINGENFKNKWHHIAIAYKNQQMKVYVDQYRVLVVPHTAITPAHLDIESIGDQKNPVVFTNFRIANGGGMNMLGKKFTDAKIITHGINFDIDQATIKPESMGTLNMIMGILKDNPELKFEVDGHTDNTGTPSHNLTLSQQRSDAVKAQLISMGVDASRLSTKGYGDTKPISDNTSLEGKANNRRVEFVKQ